MIIYNSKKINSKCIKKYEEVYYLRGYSNSQVLSAEIYNYERTTGTVYTGRQTSWTGKIALAYLSDYGYAADFSSTKLAEKCYYK